jgi:uncharacterized protein (DUF4415 family)
MKESKKSMEQNWIDKDDAPELTDEFFIRADEYDGAKLKRPGRPKKDKTKMLVSVRYEKEIIEAFKESGNGWQTRMNQALSDWLKSQKSAGDNFRT